MSLETYRLTEEPRYHPSADEVALYEAAYQMRLPVMLKGPKSFERETPVP